MDWACARALEGVDVEEADCAGLVAARDLIIGESKFTSGYG